MVSTRGGGPVVRRFVSTRGDATRNHGIYDLETISVSTCFKSVARIVGYI
jgi:hypothetical protein